MIFINLLALAMVFSESLVAVQSSLVLFGDGNSTGNEFIDDSLIPGSFRGPCPAINTLANHGFIPRVGLVDVEDLVDALQMVYGVDRNFLRDGPVQGVISFGSTEKTCNGRIRGRTPPSNGKGCLFTLSIDRLIETEHDSSFIREDGNQTQMLPSERLLDLFFEQTPEPLSNANISAYQNGRIDESCAVRAAAGEVPRPYTGGNLGGMAAQATLLMILSQVHIECPDAPFAPLQTINQNKLFSIFANQTIPADYVIAETLPDFTPFNFSTTSESDDVRDAFRAAVEATIDANDDCTR